MATILRLRRSADLGFRVERVWAVWGVKKVHIGSLVHARPKKNIAAPSIANYNCPKTNKIFTLNSNPHPKHLESPKLQTLNKPTRRPNLQTGNSRVRARMTTSLWSRADSNLFSAKQLEVMSVRLSSKLGFVVRGFRGLKLGLGPSEYSRVYDMAQVTTSSSFGLEPKTAALAVVTVVQRRSTMHPLHYTHEQCLEFISPKPYTPE